MKNDHLSTDIVIQRIRVLVRGMMTFWKSAHGWAPVEAAGLLSKSMLEWQSSLGDSLTNWNRPLSDGELILAWTNVGALVEGQLKLFLSAYHNDYAADSDAIKDKTGSVVSPDILLLEKLRVFFAKKIWGPSEPWGEWVKLVQQRRNAIHAFKSNDIGTTDEFHSNLPVLLTFIAMINNRLPYPDDIYVPREY
jgi:hypothetical protein